MERVFFWASCPYYSSVCFTYLETPPDALILESPFTNIREEAKSHPFSVASTNHIKNGLIFIINYYKNNYSKKYKIKKS